jgi:hypothetical protein
MRAALFAVMSGLVFLSIASGHANAQAAPFSDSACITASAYIDVTGTGSGSCSAPGVESAVSANPFPTMYANAYSGSGPGGALAQSILAYQFVVVGPDSGPVPIIVRGSATSSVTGEYIDYGYHDNQTATASAGLRVSNLSGLTDGYELACASDVAGECGSFPSTFSGDLDVSIAPGTTEFVSLVVNVFATYAASASAELDPIIFVDPTFADASEYSIQVSSGIGNLAPEAVPEPTAWALMILGLGLAGGGLRASRRRSALAS